MTKRLSSMVTKGLPLVFLVVAFAGCIGGDDATPDSTTEDVPEDAQPAEFGQDTGAIVGQVIDDELFPVAGAQVALLEDLELSAITAANGHFTINHVPPGKYSLHVQKLGYESAAASVSVAAGSPAEITLELVPLPVQEPWIENLPNTGYMETGIAFIRSTTCTSCGNADSTYFMFGGFPDDWAGMTVEARWETPDSLAFDLNQRGSDAQMWYRTRGEPPVKFFVEPCQEYPEVFGRSTLPCDAEQAQATQGDSSSAAHLETWYVGRFNDETHLADPVCQTGVVLPGYQAGCYGVGVAQDLRWDTWVTIFHMELPEGAEGYSAWPDS